MPQRVQDSIRKMSPFKVGEYEDGLTPLSKLELKLRELSGAIRSKPQWFEKRNNPEIVAKWKQEALEQGISEEGFNFVIQELDFYDSLRYETMCHLVFGYRRQHQQEMDHAKCHQ